MISPIVKLSTSADVANTEANDPTPVNVALVPVTDPPNSKSPTIDTSVARPTVRVVPEPMIAGGVFVII